jgi:general L-amino acid transport system substrate-binding protein
VFFDSQRILVSKYNGVRSLDGLRDRLVCALNGTVAERNLRDVMAARGLHYGLQAHSEQGEMDAAVAVQRCSAGTGSETRLAQSRANFHALVGDFVFLPERLSVDPVVPAYRYGDQAFGLVVDWTVHALVEAEALGITQANVGQSGERDDMRADRLLGHDFAVAQALGLAHDWAAKVVAATGNYGEIFDRTVGRPYHLDRGLNALWTDGGLMHPAPMQ